MGLGAKLILIPSDMPVDHALAVFGIEAVFDYRARIAEVKHELARPANDLIAALSDAWNLLYWRNRTKLL